MGRSTVKLEPARYPNFCEATFTGLCAVAVKALTNNAMVTTFFIH